MLIFDVLKDPYTDPGSVKLTDISYCLRFRSFRLRVSFVRFSFSVRFVYRSSVDVHIPFFFELKTK
jgi:hypothetical protein